MKHISFFAISNLFKSDSNAKQVLKYLGFALLFGLIATALTPQIAEAQSIQKFDVGKHYVRGLSNINSCKSRRTFYKYFWSTSDGCFSFDKNPFHTYKPELNPVSHYTKVEATPTYSDCEIDEGRANYVIQPNSTFRTSNQNPLCSPVDFNGKLVRLDASRSPRSEDNGEFTYILSYSNECSTGNPMEGQLEFEFDDQFLDLVDVQTNDSEWHQTNGINQVSIFFSGLPQNEQRNIFIRVKAKPGLKPGLRTFASLELFLTEGDNPCLLGTKTDNLTQFTLRSHDPNHKFAKQELICIDTLGTSINSNKMIYTILFQNTGIGPADSVTVVDKFEPYFDPGSINILDSSNPLSFAQNGANMEFSFSGINLRGTGEAGYGKQFREVDTWGWLQFSIDIIPPLETCAGILNQAEIYFDFNKPIFTNVATTPTTSSGCIVCPTCSLTMDKEETFCSPLTFPLPEWNSDCDTAGASYRWLPADLLDFPNSHSPIATIDTTTTFSLFVYQENQIVATAEFTAIVDCLNTGLINAMDDYLEVYSYSTSILFDPLVNDEYTSLNPIVSLGPSSTVGMVNYDLVNNVFDYIPDPNFVGIDSFSYQICDPPNSFGSVCSEAIVYINVSGIDVVDDILNVPFNTIATVDVLQNDSEANGLNIDVTNFTEPAFGTLTYTGMGGFQYSPNENYAGMDQFLYTICVDIDPIYCKTGAVQISVSTGPPVVTTLKLKAYLQGADDGSSAIMTSDLATNFILPLSQPFNTAPWFYTGSEAIGIIPGFPFDVVDWVLVELYNPNNLNTPVERQACWLYNDGSIRGINEAFDIKFNNIVSGASYTVVLRSRNHVAIASNSSIELPNLSPLDFTNPVNVKGGNSQLHLNSASIYSLIAGDLNSDGIISITDFNFYQAELGFINLYVDSDLNLDGSVTTSDFNLYQPNASHIGTEMIRY